MRNYSNTNFIKSQAKLKQISKELKKLIKYAKIEKDMAFFCQAYYIEIYIMQYLLKEGVLSL